MVLAIFVLAPIGLPEWYGLASRILGIPLIAGLSYEVIKWAGKNRGKRWVRALMWPGLMLQNLTTREPDLDQLAVAIRSLEEVLANEDPDQAKKDAPIEIVAWGIRRGELEPEGGTLTRLRRGADAAAVGFDDRLCDRESGPLPPKSRPRPGSVR